MVEIDRLESEKGVRDYWQRWRGWALLFAMTFPTWVTLVYFVWLQGCSAWIQKSAYGILKTVQFGFPLTWFWIDRRFFKKTAASKQATGRWSALIATVFGVGVAGLIIGAYFLVIQNSEAGVELVARIREKIADLGIQSPVLFIAVGVFYSLVHSGLEEYYWRWFVFRGCRRWMTFSVAATVSSLAFMAHHVVLLTYFFGWQSWLAYACSLAVAIGGWAWAWMYARTGAIWVPWLSHLFVDAAIFGLGFWLAFAVSS